MCLPGRTRLCRSFTSIALGLAVIVTAVGCVTLEPPPARPPTAVPTASAPQTATSPPLPIATPTALAIVTPVPVTAPPPPVTPAAPATLPATAPPTAAGPTPIASQLALDATGEEALVATMLEPVDVDPSAETSGIDIGTEADDLPAFAAEGGLRRAAQTLDVGFDYTVFDFRYQFPDAESAAAFLDAEADGLGETHYGAVEGPRPLLPGDDVRYYTAHTEIFVVQDSFNYLIREENIVAKVWIGGDPEFIDSDKAFDIAAAVAVRLGVVLGSI